MTTFPIGSTQRRPRLAVPPRPRRRARLFAWIAGAAAVAALHAWAWRATDFSFDELVTGWNGIVDFLGGAVPPDLTWNTVVRPGLEACGVTLAIGLLGTTFSIPTSLALAVLGARTTSRNPVVYQVSRAVMSFFRAVPDIVFALIFVTAVGLGPFAGVLALVCHNTGVMSKLWSEAMEEIESGPIDALRVAGASGPQVAAHVVLPSVVPQCVGLLLPEGKEGEQARGILPDAVQTSHDRLCTVGRTVELGTPITTHTA